MSHCPYLLHKATSLTIVLCALFIWVTDCSIRVSQSFTRGLPSGLLHLYDYDFEIYNIAAIGGEPMHTRSKQSHRVPHLQYLSSTDFFASVWTIHTILCITLPSNVQTIDYLMALYNLWFKRKQRKSVKDASLPAMFNPLCSSTNQQLFKKNFCNWSSHHGRFP